MMAFFLLLAAACLTSGAALAQCLYAPAATSLSAIPQYPPPGTGETTIGLPTNVPCYVTIQPIDVCGTTGFSTCAPFNAISANGVGVPNGNTSLPKAGWTAGNTAFMNTLSPNPIYFVVDPSTGASPPPAGDMNGVDVLRALSTQLGYDVLLMPMQAFNSPNNPKTGTTFQTLNISEDDTQSPPVFTSTDFQTLSFQNSPPQPGFSQGNPTPPPPTSPSTCGQNGSVFPCAPWAAPNIVESYSVTKLNPPTQQAGGKLHGFGWICNKAIATDQSIYGYPVTRPPSAQSPLTIAHELGHNFCLNHRDSFGAGDFTLPAVAPAAPYTAPAGVVLTGSSTPLLSGQCDASYPACGSNLMTAGNLRTEATPQCVLLGINGPTTVPTFCLTGTGNQKAGLYPGFYNGMAKATAAGIAGQVTTFSTDPKQTNLPLSQQQEVLAPPPVSATPPTQNSGLLSVNPNFSVFTTPTKSGLLNPIPLETTKAQAGTGGSASDPIIFDVSSPIGGRPGETVVAWILMLPEEQTFAGGGRFHISSQSRQDLVQRVDYFPEAEKNPLMRNIAYRPSADNLPVNPSAADDPEIGPYNACIARRAQCLMVEFQPPGLGAKDSISFSTRILSGGAPITNDDLCKAKITYIFSDGYATTANFGRCPAASLPLIASSWQPDLTVSPWIVKSAVVLAQATTDPLPCTPSTGPCGPLVLADANPREEWGQGDLCSNGGGNGIDGVIHDNVTVLSGQYCVFNKDSRILGNLLIQPGGKVSLSGELNGTLNDDGGALLNLDASAIVNGNVNITDSSAFVIRRGAEVFGNLNITDATGPQTGFVSGATVTQNVNVQGSQSRIQINDNTIQGNLICMGNNPIPTGSNTVSGTPGVMCTN
jgi:hypothetical protein